MDASNALSNHREQIAELHQRLIEYIQKTTQNFSILQDRFDTIQVEVNKISTQTSITNDHYSSRFKNIETKMTQISNEIDKLYTIINVNKERSLKTFEKYLCELCSHAIVQQGKNNEYKFVVCNMNMKKFPSDKKCPEFILEEGIEE